MGTATLAGVGMMSKIVGVSHLVTAICIWLAVANTMDADDILVVVGAGGTDEYSSMFNEWAEEWKTVAGEAKFDLQEIGKTEPNSYAALQSAISARSKSGDSPLWIVLIGHGTFDKKLAKFNLRGKDVEARELADWLKPCDRPLILINAFSCSGAFLEPLQAPNRVVITATKNGAELNFSRFGKHMAAALSDMSADLDHDDQVSLLEAFLLASSKVKQFYESDARLMTEHALLEDNHDGKGVSADFFKGIRAVRSAKSGEVLDGQHAHRYIIRSSPDAVKLTADEIATRDRIETEIELLRAKKQNMFPDEYYQELEMLMLELAKLYEQH